MTSRTPACLRSLHKVLRLVPLLGLVSCAFNSDPNAVHARSTQCMQLQQMVKQQGSRTIYSGLSHVSVFSDSGACPRGTTEPYEAYYTSLDKRACFVGYSCRRLSFDE